MRSKIGLVAWLAVAAMVGGAAAQEGVELDPLGAWKKIEAQVKVSPYWIGVQFGTVDPVLRAQLGIPEDQGLIVEQVVEESPAAKAGLQQHDVVLKFGETGVGTVGEMVDAVDENKDQAAKLTIVRQGKTQQLEITPAKRPETEWLEEQAVPQYDQLRDQINKALRDLEAGGDGPKRFRLAPPRAWVVPGRKIPKLGFPKDLRVTITKRGDDPAKLTVSRGEKTWEVTEDKLDELPDDVRPHVERMLGHGAAGHGGAGTPFWFDLEGLHLPQDGSQIEGRIEVEPVRPAPGERRGQVRDEMERRLEKRLEEMNRRLDQIRGELDRLHGDTEGDADPDES